MPNATIATEVSWPTTWEGAWSLSWSAITADVKSISIRRGRSSDMGSMQQSTCTIRLKDATGKYNPENAGSALAPNLIPMKPLRVQATYNATTYDLFWGLIRRIEHDPDPNVKESIIEAVDLTVFYNIALLHIDSMNAGVAYTNQTVGYLLGEILDSMGFPQATWGDLNDGVTIPSFAPDGTASALSLIRNLLEVDRGTVFFGGNGKLIYRDVDTLYAQQAVVATFDGTQVTGLRSTITDDGIVNVQHVTKTGGVEQTSVSLTSQYKYGSRPASFTSSYLASNAQAASLAGFLIATRANPQSPARQMGIVNGDATRLVQQLARDLADYVTVSETAGGTSFSGWIASIEHEISDGFLVHRTRFAVQKRTVTFLILNGGFETAGAGGADVFANWVETDHGGTITRSTGANEFNGGVAGCKLTGDASVDANVYQLFTVVPGDTCVLNFCTRGDGTYAGRYQVRDITNTAYIITLTSTGVTGTTWTYVEASFTVPAGCVSALVQFYCPATDARTAYFDDVQIYEPA